MRPDDETQEFDQVPGDDDESAEPKPPPPATYAGRMRAEPPPAEEEPEPVEEPDPEPPPVEEPEPDEVPEPVAEAEPEEEPEAEEEPEPEPAAPAEQEAEEPEPEAEEPQAEEEAEEPEAEAEEPEAEEPAAEQPDASEEAQEAALAGLRARTAEHAARQGKPETEVSAPPPAPVAVAADAEEGNGKTPRAKPVWARFLAASLVIVFSMAAATSISILVFLTDFAEGLGGIHGVQRNLEDVDGGEPQTILILGSDVRPGEKPAQGTAEAGRSDTTMLLRVDPDRGAMTLLSIPRDLKVSIPNPGFGVDRFNAAYTYGGPKLTLEVVKRVTGLEINHVVNIDFNGFADAVNSIGCVYIDVDRHYFHSNEGLAFSEQYAEIDIEAGYQRLCGFNALQYVRYRHEDTDLVRAARQQDFLREARQKIEPAKLAFNADYRNDLVDIFKQYTTSDDALRDPIQVLELMKTFVAARNAPVREVHFPAELGGPGDPFVTADDAAIKEAVAQFLGTEGTPGPAPTGQAEEPQGDDGGGDGKEKPGNKPKPDPEEASGLIDATMTGQDYARRLAKWKQKDGDPMLDFPVFYPTRLLASSTLNEATRAFPIDGPSDEVYHGYKFVAGFPGSGGFTEYYGVSGTDWTDAPILENPSETRTIDGRDYMLYYDGDRLRLVAFRTKNAVYWVINTLTQTLDEDQMISIATSMRERG
jgi:polyisoprenyl-teichoic acid--peptidoglycan teichoic acid transferase